MKKTLLVNISVILLFLICSAFIYQVGETTLKAVFIERVSRFIDWPDEILSEKDDRLLLTVIGEHEFGPVLDQIYSEYKIKDRDVEIRYVNDMDSLDGSHIIFVGNLQKSQIRELFKLCADKPILIISDHREYQKEGLMLIYYLLDENITFDINLTAVKQSGLMMSYHLLNRANIYEIEITD
ncbi:MAG: YfiR family protein [Bacteroidales bacterium]|nr:YfiR family protein [Bacteroidales bacterium]